MKINYLRRQIIHSVSALAIMLLTSLPLHAKPKTVLLSTGSTDGDLATAIAAAGPWGMVIVESGVHHEIGTVLVDIPVAIWGEPGAILESTTTPSNAPFMIEAALHVKGTANVLIEGLELRPPSGSDGGTAIVIEDSPRVSVVSNIINDYQFGVIIQRGDRAEINGNGIYSNVPGSRGIQMLNGRSVGIVGNEIMSTGGAFGMFLADANGKCHGNRVSGYIFGVFHCKMPNGVFVISGSSDGSQVYSNGWHVQGNESFDNAWGFLLIDGVHNSVYANNAAWNNANYDIELAGDSNRFGFFTPTTHDNVVTQGSHKNLVIKDCGLNNVVSGDATLVDHSVDPCN